MTVRRLIALLSSLALLLGLTVSMVSADHDATGPATDTWNVHAQLKSFPQDRRAGCATGFTLFRDQFQSVTAGGAGGTLSKDFVIDGKTVTFTITWYPNNSFDFLITGGTTSGIFVKANEYRLHQYQPPVALATNAGPVSSDTNLVASSTASPGGEFQDVSHLDLCLAPVQNPDVSVVKTPDGEAGAPGTIDAGQDAVFTIVVTNNGPGAASDVMLEMCFLLA